MPVQTQTLNSILPLTEVPVGHEERHDERRDGERRRSDTQDFHHVVVGCIARGRRSNFQFRFEVELVFEGGRASSVVVKAENDEDANIRGE